MRRIFTSFLSPSQADRQPGRRLAFLAVTIAMCAFQIVDALSNVAWTRADAFLLIAFSVVLFKAGHYAPAVELLYALLYTAGAILDVTSNLDFLSLGIFAITTDWLVRSWTVRALALYAVATLADAQRTNMALSDHLWSDALWLAVIVFLAFSIRRQNQRYAVKSEEARTLQEKVETIEADTRRTLAGELHDTLAKDLAHLAITARKLAETPEAATAAELEGLAEAAASASKRIRPVILDLDATRREASLETAIDSASTLLSTRSIELETQADAELDAQLDRRARGLAALVVREGATNILKYAPEGSVARLMATLEDSILSLTLTNTIAEHAYQAPGVTGGYGLANLAHRIRSEGGELDFATVGTSWMLHADIPLTKGPAA